MFFLRKAAALLLIVGIVPAGAQERRANLAGTVRSRSAPLSDVTVAVRGQLNQQVASAITGTQGSFRFAGLPCGGAYTLVLSRAGWETRRISHLPLRCGSTLQVRVELYSAAESSRRRAPAEISDESPWWGTQFGPLQIEDLPNARNIWSLLETQEPSSVTDRIDIAGLETGEPALFGALGASWTENQYRLNGLNVTDSYLPGFRLFDPSLDNLAQFQVTTGAKPAAEGAGTNIDLATPEPVATWHGGARLFYSSDALQSDNFNSRLARLHFPGPERMNHVEDGSTQVGGKLPQVLGSLPFYTSFSTQRLDKSLGGFAAPIRARIYRGLANVTAYSRGRQRLDLLYYGQHVSDTHEAAAPNVAPSATTRGNRNFHQFQGRWSKANGPATVFSASGGLVKAVLSSAIQNGVRNVSTLDLPQMTLTGSAPLLRSGVRTSYQGQGMAQTLRAGPGGTHSLSLGADWERSDISNSWYAVQNLQAITVGGVGAEVIRWNTPARAR